MKKYDSYKDSGIEWIGEIPFHWNIRKLKFVCKIFNGDSLKDEEKELYSQEIENAIPYVSTKDIDVWTSKINYENSLSIPVDHSRYKIAPKNSFLMCIEGGSAGRKYSHLEKDVFFVNKLACFETKSENNKFLYYYSQSPLFQSQFQNSLSGLIGGVAISQIRNFSVILPIPEEQTAIANYLDQKTSEIDDLIAKKERLIQLLEEERTAMINQAVTKGLNPTVPMKDSGIEWLGEIPEHWECNQLRRFIEDRRKVTYGIVQPGEYDPYGHFMVRGQDYSKGWAHPDTIFRVTPKIEEPYARARLKTGDILYTIVGAGVGNIAIVPEWLNEANITQTTARLAINQEKANSEYIFYFLQSVYAEIQLSIYVKGAAQPGMNLSDLKLYYFTLPPIAEQKDIAEYIKINCSRISETTNVLSKEIELIKEYKTALISEVVTGKVCLDVARHKC